ncbi:MAG: hypothetical protein EAZ20_00340 [Bacteroidetes bacterium]|nr:MAG: hypothetical protein EAZ20_00340 [Bacteroidota bacterium]
MLENFEKKFKDLAEKTEIPYNPQDWKELSKRIQNTKQKWVIWKKLAVAAAVLLFLCVPTYLLMQNYLPKNLVGQNNNISKDNQQKNNQTFNNQTFNNQSKKIDKNTNTNQNNLKNDNLSTENEINNANNNYLKSQKLDSQIKNENINPKEDLIKNQFVMATKNNIEKNNTLNINKKENKNIENIVENNLKPKNNFELLENNILSENYIHQNITPEYNAKKTEEIKQQHCFGLINQEQTNGVQLGILANISKKSAEQNNPEDAPIFQKRNKRTQIAGFINQNNQDYQDTQLSLLSNKANKITRLQTSMLFNNTKILEGTQIGLVNRAKKMKGRQFGLINIMDSAQGTPIGLITIVGINGYQQLEVGMSEIFQTNLSYKLGTKKFYNIFSVATGYSEPDLKWALGYGFGRKFQFNEKNSANLDFTAYHLNKNSTWTRELLEIFQLKFNYHIKVNKTISIFAGPVVNLLVSDVKSPDLNFNGFTPYTISQGYIGNTIIKSWIGFNGGIAF